MKRFAALPLLLLLASCGTKVVYLNRDLGRVLVVPPFNSAGEMESSEIVWPLVVGELASRGYDVVSVDEVRAFYEKNKFSQPEEIKQYKNPKLGEIFNAQGIVYTDVTFWGKEMIGIYNYVGVEADFQLVDAKSGDLVWEALDVKAGEDNNPASRRTSGGRKGLLGGALLGAAEAALTSPSSFADDVVYAAFRAMPHMGWDPEVKAKMGESPNPNQ